MRLACVAFVVGTWSLQQQAGLPPHDGTAAVAIGAAIGALALTATAARRRRRAVGDRRSATTEPVRGADRRAMAVALAADAVVVGFAAIVGFGWAAWCAERRLADALPPSLENVDVVVVGTVSVLPTVEARGTRFEFAVESVVSRDGEGRPLAIPRRLALGWYRPPRGDAIPLLKPGQRWRLTVRLKRPHGSANPFGFDYEYWLLEEGLRATGYVRPGAESPNEVADDEARDADVWSSDTDRPTNDPDGRRGDGTRGPPQPLHDSPTSTRKLSEFVWSAGHVVERLRWRLRERIVTTLASGGALRVEAPYAGVIVALVVGDQRSIAQSDWTVFNRTGIGHLVSISGLHVSMLAALGAWLVFATWRRRPAWCARLPAPKAAAVAGATVALAYCLLAGFGVPAQRTLYMIGVVAFALWTGRLVAASRVLAIAAVVVVAIDPWAATGSGFWLSFAAVAAIFWVGAGRIAPARDDSARTSATGAHDPGPVPRWSSRIREDLRARSARLGPALRSAARIQWAVTLALTPPTLLFFYQVSVISPLANALAIPLVSFVVTPLALAGAVIPGFIGDGLLHAAHGLVAALAWWLQWLSATPIAVWSGAAPPAWAFAAAIVGVAWWLAPRGLSARWTGALWLVPLFALPPDRPSVGDARLTAVDIGQGTAVLVETATHVVLFDTGPRYGAPGDRGDDDAGNDAGNRILVPLLRAKGIARVDTMIVSHNDDDHSGGALSLLAALPVAETRSSLALDTPIVRASARHARCEPGQSWAVDDVRFELLAPDPDVYVPRGGKALAKPNARSCVLRIEAAGRVALLTADIEKPQETALVERRRDRIAADVLLVPHHGSRTSSTDAFLDAVHPSLAIVQAGYLNRFGHPRPDVLARYAARAIPVLRNDRDGAITVTIGTSGLAVERYRDAHRRYWYGR